MKRVDVRSFIARLLAVSTMIAACAQHVVAETNVDPSVEDEEAFLDDLQRRTFNFFWETANPANGLVPDRWPSDSACSIAAVGFGLTAYGIGVERGYIDREQAAERTLTTLKFFAKSPQSDEPNASGHHGFYYHFLDMETGRRAGRCELSSIDTGLLIMGVLYARQYFDGDNPREQEIRRLADELYQRVEWKWFQPRAPLVCMSWQPERGFGDHDYRGYNEAMFLYVLALGSPTHAVDNSAWEAFVESYEWTEFYGEEHLNFSPLFGHQYSHCWIDFRGIQDAFIRSKGIDYFENSRRATLSQRAYAIDNPRGWKGYGENVWGLTACDGPTNGKYQYAGEMRDFQTYSARGASSGYINDDGTIAPTAAGGSIPFAPGIALAALQAMRLQYGETLYGQYGFLDSFNPSFTFAGAELRHGRITPEHGWVNGDYLGIDQGPILLMIENHRTGHVWEVLKRNAAIRTGLKRAGFTDGWLDKKE